MQRQLKDPGIVKAYSLDTFEGRMGLLLEDFGGVSFKQMLSIKKLSIAGFLNAALQLAKALVSVHQHQIIHKDIKPANIIINPTSGIVKLTDFSIASRLSQETPELINPDQIQGTLAYMSPEQTGRMNRTLDCRSDLYSLGVTFYEMLSGELPFQSNDSLELVYCHLAKEPVPLRELNPKIPDAIAQIVEKLMAKDADDRYQSAAEILADLQNYFAKFPTTGKMFAHLEKINRRTDNDQIDVQPKYDLAEAERCRRLGKTSEAMEVYGRAIQAAAENGCIQEEAFVNKIAAKFYREIAHKNFAQTYMTELGG
jgi:serine/threonine protein kinase